MPIILPKKEELSKNNEEALLFREKVCIVPDSKRKILYAKLVKLDLCPAKTI